MEKSTSRNENKTPKKKWFFITKSHWVIKVSKYFYKTLPSIFPENGVEVNSIGMTAISHPHYPAFLRINYE